MGNFCCLKRINKNKKHRLTIDSINGKSEHLKGDVEVYYSGFIGNKTGNISSADFELLKKLGQGSFGLVVLARHKTSRKLYALKILNKRKVIQQDHISNLRDERNILAKIKFPFLSRLKYAFQTTENIYLATDFFQGGELFNHKRNEEKFEEHEARFYISEIILAIDYLHENDIIYRDLKPENVLLDKKGHVKLTDFGLSKLLKSVDTRSNTVCGTPEYLAPEVVEGKSYDKSIDWWSVGVLLYKMISGFTPFHVNMSNCNPEVFKKEIDFPYYFSYEVKDLIVNLLKYDPSERYGSNSVNDILRHDFFIDINWEKLRNREIEPPIKLKIEGELDTKYFFKQDDDSVIRLRKDSEEDESLKNKNFDSFSFIYQSDKEND